MVKLETHFVIRICLFILHRSSSNESLFNMPLNHLSSTMTPRQTPTSLSIDAFTDEKAQIWSIEDTDEVFTSYEEYLQR